MPLAASAVLLTVSALPAAASGWDITYQQTDDGARIVAVERAPGQGGGNPGGGGGGGGGGSRDVSPFRWIIDAAKSEALSPFDRINACPARGESGVLWVFNLVWREAADLEYLSPIATDQKCVPTGINPEVFVNATALPPTVGEVLSQGSAVKPTISGAPDAGGITGMRSTFTANGEVFGVAPIARDGYVGSIAVDNGGLPVSYRWKIENNVDTVGGNTYDYPFTRRGLRVVRAAAVYTGTYTLTVGGAVLETTPLTIVTAYGELNYPVREVRSVHRKP